MCLMVSAVPVPVPSESLTEAVHGLTAAFDRLTVFTYRQRTFVRLLAVSVVLDIMLSLAAIGFGVTISRVADQAHQATSVTALTHAAAVTQCNTGNDYRTQDRALWAQLLAMPTTPQTPAQVAARANFITFLDAHDKLRDCTLIP